MADARGSWPSPQARVHACPAGAAGGHAGACMLGTHSGAMCLQDFALRTHTARTHARARARTHARTQAGTRTRTAHPQRTQSHTPQCARAHTHAHPSAQPRTHARTHTRTHLLVCRRVRDHQRLGGGLAQEVRQALPHQALLIPALPLEHGGCRSGCVSGAPLQGPAQALHCHHLRNAGVNVNLINAQFLPARQEQGNTLAI